MPGMNMKQMQAMFKQLGIKTRDINAEKVIIKSDSGDIIVNNPKITEIDMKGVKTFQISGEIEVKTVTDEDVKFVANQTGASEEDAKKALEETGDVAEAILKLKDHE